MGRSNDGFRIHGLLFIPFLTLFINQSKATTFVTGDIDLRYRDFNFKRGELELHAVSFSLRKTFADKFGDRMILFLLVEAMHNFKEGIIDQAYLQYKGPLGKWNITLGRYRLPYGLLPNYSTERLLITTIEDETIGICSDNGLQLSGVIGDFDYAISLSQGVGQAFKPINIGNQGLISFRVGYQGVDFEALGIGLSGLLGKIAPRIDNEDRILNKRLLGVDLIKYWGQLALRGELSFGEESGKMLLGIFSGADYMILPKVDLNTGYALVKIGEDRRRHSLSVGLTYNIFPGFQMRTAWKFPINGGENELHIQTYYIFSRGF